MLRLGDTVLFVVGYALNARLNEYREAVVVSVDKDDPNLLELEVVLNEGADDRHLHVDERAHCTITRSHVPKGRQGTAEQLKAQGVTEAEMEPVQMVPRLFRETKTHVWFERAHAKVASGSRPLVP